MFYIVKVKVKVENNKGKLKTHTEQYLVDAVSVTDAEATVVKSEFSNVTFDFEVASVNQTKIVKVVQ